jgi:uncharacterized protein YndB with AHSA1/START domain
MSWTESRVKEAGDTHATAEPAVHTRRFERRFAYSPERVWRALTEPTELARWFPAEIRGALEPGARLWFVPRTNNGLTPPPDDATPTTGAMLSCEPPRILEYSCGDQILCWELQPRDGRTLLLFTQTFANDSQAGGAGAWIDCLDSLARALAGAPRGLPSPLFNADHGELAELPI